MSNNSRHIPVVLNFLMTSVPVIESEISKTITELMYAGQIADVHTIINCLTMNNVTKDVMQNLVNNFMNKLVILNALIDDIIKYANDSGCSQQVLTDVAEICLKLGRKKLCLTIFQVMRNKNTEIRPHYYWPLVRAYHNKREAEIYSLMKSMIKEDIEIDFDTLLHYVLPYVNTANPIIILQKLLLNNVPSSVICTPLFSFLLQQRRLQDIIPLCKYATKYIIKS